MSWISDRCARFNNTVGALSWNGRSAMLHPDRCECQDESTPHKHYPDPPHACARCGHQRCPRYWPALLSVAQRRAALEGRG